MSEEKTSLEKIIEEETEKIEEKYSRAENLTVYFPAWKINEKTGIDCKTIKLMNLKRKKKNLIKELEKEIDDLDFEIGYKMGFEIDLMKSKYENEFSKDFISTYDYTTSI